MAQDTYNTYAPLQTIVLTQNTGIVQFGVNPSSSSSADWIPQHYIDLVLVVQGSSVNGTASGLCFRFNGDTANYGYTLIDAWNGGSPTSYKSTTQSSISIGWNGRYSSGINPSAKIEFLKYSNPSCHKMTLSEQSSPQGPSVGISRWASTSPIKTIQLALGSSFPDDQWASGSTFALYGVGLRNR